MTSLSMKLCTTASYTTEHVEDWMWERAATRRGFYQIQIPFRSWSQVYLRGFGAVSWRTINLTQKEYSVLEKAVSNQLAGESKDKTHRQIVYQRGMQLWNGDGPDDISMRALGMWATSAYLTQHIRQYPNLSIHAAVISCGPTCLWQLWQGKYKWAAAIGGLALAVGCASSLVRVEKHVRLRIITDPRLTEEETQVEDAHSAGHTRNVQSDSTQKRNKLGYQKEGAEYVNEHPGGGVDADDSEIRAGTQGRLQHTEAGVGVIGQTLDDEGKKQICGVLSLPISKEPNVYAQNSANVKKAIEERIDKKQKDCVPTKEDKTKIGYFVATALGEHPRSMRIAPFSTKKICKVVHELLINEVKSKKWTDDRLERTIEKLCQDIDPKFKLSAAVKLESMPEEKAPRMLIADGDEGQVMALLTIHVMEKLIKDHYPNKGIKGVSKRDAIKRVMKHCRMTDKQAKAGGGTTTFEGDGSAWDTTCTAILRAMVENPVIIRIANILQHYIMYLPAHWHDEHVHICSKKELDLFYKKNKERVKILIAAIRRSGHRGTSCLNWWVNFTMWHCAIYAHPEEFLDPNRIKGEDVRGTMRWLRSAYEGDDSFLVTTPKLQSSDGLLTDILQFWDRMGFNMKIEIRDKRALFVGYYLGLDGNGPLYQEKDGRETCLCVPEIDRCFARSGTSCSPSTIEAFKRGDRKACVKLAGSAAMSRAYEFCGLAPTISRKYLNYALECKYEMTHDLKMRTHEEFEDVDELVEHIIVANDTCENEEAVLTACGFWASDEEREKFNSYEWDYDRLADWQGFYESLPATWRQ